MFLKYVKCRTILGLVWQKNPTEIWEVTPNGIHLTLFEVLLPIYKHADLKVIKRIEKLREESLV